MRFLQITSKRTFWAKKVISSRGHSHGCHLRFPASQFTVLFYNFPTVEQCGHHHFIWTFSNYPSFSSREIIYQKKKLFQEMSTALPLLFQQIPHWIFVVWIPESQKTLENFWIPGKPLPPPTWRLWGPNHRCLRPVFTSSVTSVKTMLLWPAL